MKKLLNDARCPYCKKEHDSNKNWNKGVNSLFGEYYSDTISQTCEYCKETFDLSVTEIRRFSARKPK